MLRLTLLFVKTARAILYQGYMPALAVDGMVADELTTVDGVSPPPREVRIWDSNRSPFGFVLTNPTRGNAS